MSKKVLIVDDEADIRKVVSFRLNKIGYEVLLAIDGQQGLDMIYKDKPDIILLDLHLPVITGYEICRRVKADENLKHIPIIFFSASSGSEIENHTKDYGADDYIVKPFKADDLIAKIKKYLD